MFKLSSKGKNEGVMALLTAKGNAVFITPVTINGKDWEFHNDKKLFSSKSAVEAVLAGRYKSVKLRLSSPPNSGSK